MTCNNCKNSTSSICNICLNKASPEVIEELRADQVEEYMRIKFTPWEISEFKKLSKILLSTQEKEAYERGYKKGFGEGAVAGHY